MLNSFSRRFGPAMTTGPSLVSLDSPWLLCTSGMATHLLTRICNVSKWWHGELLKVFFVFVFDFNISSHEKGKKWINCCCHSSCATSQKKIVGRHYLPWEWHILYLSLAAPCKLRDLAKTTLLLLLSSTQRTYDQHRTHSDFTIWLLDPIATPYFGGVGG